MALQLMKLTVSAETTVDIVPIDTRFFYVTSNATPAGSTLTIDAADFFADDGTAVTELPALAANNSYFNVYVNGVLQMRGISTYTPGTTGTGSLAIAVLTGGKTIPARAPIVLEIINYDPTTTTTITT
ncbi:DUF4183 domain-containing protein [Virgibacillus sp. FSP13]